MATFDKNSDQKINRLPTIDEDSSSTPEESNNLATTKVEVCRLKSSISSECILWTLESMIVSHLTFDFHLNNKQTQDLNRSSIRWWISRCLEASFRPWSNSFKIFSQSMVKLFKEMSCAFDQGEKTFQIERERRTKNSIFSFSLRIKRKICSFEKFLFYRNATKVKIVALSLHRQSNTFVNWTFSVENLFESKWKRRRKFRWNVDRNRFDQQRQRHRSRWNRFSSSQCSTFVAAHHCA